MRHHLSIDRILQWQNLGLRILGLFSGAILFAYSETACSETDAAARRISLNECIEIALVNNRALQIERLNPRIARATLGAAYGYYDPLFTGSAKTGSKTEAGGFDLVNLDDRPASERDEDSVNIGLTGFLPSGLSYSVQGLYDHSFGEKSGFNQYTGAPETSNFDSYDVDASLYIQQPLLKNLWIDQGRLTIQVNKRNLKFTELGVVFMTMNTMNLVQQAYYDLLFARENLEVQQGLRATRAAFLAGILRQVQGGTRTLSEQRMAEAQLAAVEADLIMASNMVVLAENELKTQLGDAFTNRIDEALVPTERLVVVPQVFDLAESRQQGLALRADLAQLREDVEKAKVDLRYRRNQLFPALDFVAGYGRRGVSTAASDPATGFDAKASLKSAFDQVGSGDNPNRMFGLVLSMPLSRAAERGNFRASRELKEQAVLLVKQKEELVLREVTDAFDTARTSLNRVTATRRATEAARLAVQIEEQRLTGGKSDVFFVLQLQANLAAAQSAEVRAKADYNKAVSQLDFAEGSLLNKKRMTVEYR